MSVSITGLPSTVESPLWVYDIALNSVLSRTAKPPQVVELEVRFDAGASPVRDLRVDLDGSGVITPIGATEVAKVRAGRHARVKFRWAVPIRTTPPPYELPLTATASYRSGGAPKTITATATTSVEPPDPPTEDSYVSDLPFNYLTNGYGTVHRDQALAGYGPDDAQPMIMNSVTYAKGIGVNTVSDVGVHLGGNCRTFSAVIGVDDGAGDAASVVFRVVGDGRKLYESGVMRPDSTPESIKVDVRGVNQLDLIVDDAGDGHGDDHGDWAEARLLV